MNEQRRKAIAKAAELLETAAELLDMTADAEEDELNRMPLNLQISRQGIAMRNNADIIAYVVEQIRQAAEDITEAIK